MNKQIVLKVEGMLQNRIRGRTKGDSSLKKHAQ